MELPTSFENNMRALLGDEYGLYLACLDKPMFHGIRINTSKISVEDFLKINPFSLEPVPWCKNGFYYDEKKDKPSKHPYYYAGLYYIQEPSAMTPASVLPVEDGDRVLDICAAPGGKSTELAARLKRTGLLFSNDASASRAKALLKNIELFGTANAVITSETPDRLSERFYGYFDKILIDAPCSGEGMFRKSGAMITAWEKNGNQMFADIQRDILKETVKMLKAGGMLVYSTCTFSPLENERSVEYMLGLDDSLHVEAFDKHGLFDDGRPEWSEWGSAELTKCARLWPHRLDGEGHFVCLVKKDGARADNEQTGSYPVKRGRISPETEEFLSRVKACFDIDRLEVSNDKLYYIPRCFPDIRGLRIVRCGLFMGEMKKNRFEPSQALAMALKKDDFDNVVDMGADDMRVIKYLKGETIEAGAEDGIVLVCVDGYPLGWGKLKGGVMKNKYLSGWRLMS